MSAKFKPSKKKVELEASVDDWEVSEEEQDKEQQRQQRQQDEDILVKQTKSLNLAQGSLQKQNKKEYQNAWDDDGTEAQTTKEAKALWEEANQNHPQIQPIIQNRTTLPTNLLAPRLSSPSSSSIAGIGPSTSSSSTIMTNSHMNGEYDHRPPPQILRRDRNAEREAAEAAAALAEANGKNRKKTLAEREEEYKKARERIFGTLSKTNESVGGGETRSSSRTGSGSDTGGRNSPNTSTSKIAKGKKLR